MNTVLATLTPLKVALFDGAGLAALTALKVALFDGLKGQYNIAQGTRPGLARPPGAKAEGLTQRANRFEHPTTLSK